MRLTCQVINSMQGLNGIRPQWEELVETNETSHTFQSWEWNRMWCEIVLPSIPGSSLSTRVIRDSTGAIVAIFPLFKKRLFHTRFSVSNFLGHRISYHHDIICARHVDDVLMQDIVNALAESVGFFDLIHLRNLHGSSLMTRILLNQGKAIEQCTRLRILAKDGFDPYYETLSKEFRRVMRRRKKRLSEDHDVVLQVADKESAISALDDLLTLHKMRFKSKGQDTVLMGSALEFIQKMFGRLLAEGKAEIVELSVGDRTIASSLVLNSGDTSFAINGGFDPEYGKYAIQNIVLLEAIRHIVEDRGLVIFDLGPGYESNKYDWKPSVDHNYFACIGGNQIVGHLFEKLYSFAFLKSLPPTNPDHRES